MKDKGEILYQAIVAHHACVQLVSLLSQTDSEAVNVALAYMRRTEQALGEATTEEAMVARERTILLCDLLTSLAGDVDASGNPGDNPGEDGEPEGDESEDDESDDDSEDESERL